MLNVNDAPTFVSADPTEATENEYVFITFTVADIDLLVDEDETLDVRVISKPDWLNTPNIETRGDIIFEPVETGQRMIYLAGTPGDLDVGDNEVVIGYTDAAGPELEEVVTITVLNVNDAPTVDGIEPESTDEDAEYVGTISASDVDFDDAIDPDETLTIELGDDAPSWFGSVTDNEDGTMTVSGTPTNDEVGEHSFTVTVTDNDGEQDQQTLTVEVLNVNDAPTFVSADPTEVPEDSYAFITFTVADVDLLVDLDETLDVRIVSKPDWLQIPLTETINGFTTIETGQRTIYLAGTPDDPEVGEHTVVIGYTDAAGPELSESVTITVTPVNDPPTANDDEYLDTPATAGVPYQVAAPGLIDNDDDPDVDDSLSVDAGQVDSAQGGVVALASDGGFTYLAPPEFVGEDTFSYTVRDEDDVPSSATVTVVVQAGAGFVVDNSGGIAEVTPGCDVFGGLLENGTLCAPFDALADVEAASVGGETITVYTGDSRTPGSEYGPIQLKDGQSLMGVGDPAPLLTGSDKIIALANDNTIDNIDVLGASGWGVHGIGVEGGSVSNMIMNGVVGGVHIQGGGEWTFSDLAISAVDQGFVYIGMAGQTTPSVMMENIAAAATGAVELGSIGLHVKNVEYVEGTGISVTSVGPGVSLTDILANNLSIDSITVHPGESTADDICLRDPSLRETPAASRPISIVNVPGTVAGRVAIGSTAVTTCLSDAPKDVGMRIEGSAVDLVDGGSHSITMLGGASAASFSDADVTGDLSLTATGTATGFDAYELSGTPSLTVDITGASQGFYGEMSALTFVSGTVSALNQAIYCAECEFSGALTNVMSGSDALAGKGSGVELYACTGTLTLNKLNVWSAETGVLVDPALIPGPPGPPEPIDLTLNINGSENSVSGDRAGLVVSSTQLTATIESVEVGSVDNRGDQGMSLYGNKGSLVVGWVDIYTQGDLGLYVSIGNPADFSLSIDAGAIAPTSTIDVSDYSGIYVNNAIIDINLGELNVGLPQVIALDELSVVDVAPIDYGVELIGTGSGSNLAVIGSGGIGSGGQLSGIRRYGVTADTHGTLTLAGVSFMNAGESLQETSLCNDGLTDGCSAAIALDNVLTTTLSGVYVSGGQIGVLGSQIDSLTIQPLGEDTSLLTGFGYNDFTSLPVRRAIWLEEFASFTLTDTTVERANEELVYLSNTGVAGTISVTGSEIIEGNSDGLSLMASDLGSIAGQVHCNRIDQLSGAAINASAGADFSDPDHLHIDLDVDRNAIGDADEGTGYGVMATAKGAGQLDVTIANHDVDGGEPPTCSQPWDWGIWAFEQPLSIANQGSGLLTAQVESNFFSARESYFDSITISNDGPGLTDATVTNNTFEAGQYGALGMSSWDPQGELRLVYKDNTVTADEFLEPETGLTVVGSGDVCLDYRGINAFEVGGDGGREVDIAMSDFAGLILPGIGLDSVDPLRIHAIDYLQPMTLPIDAFIDVTLALEGTEELLFGGTCDAPEQVRPVCFVAGTLVSTLSGPQPIETLREGDVVLSRSEDDRNAKLTWRPVVDTFRFENKPVMDLVLRSQEGVQETTTVTVDHPYWVESEGWVNSGQLETGDRVAGRDGRSHEVISTTRLEAHDTVFNIHVAEDNTYFVGDLQTWVHNRE